MKSQVMFGHMTPTHVFRAQPKVKKKKKKAKELNVGHLVSVINLT